MSPVETPLVASRSLGRLLGLGSLWLKLESCQPSGSWLERGAEAVVEQAARDGVRGLALAGPGPLAVVLALAAARAGLRAVWFTSVEEAAGRHAAWLVAAGGTHASVEASPAALQEALPAVAARAGLRLVWPDDPILAGGVRGLLPEIARQLDGADYETLAISAIAGPEGSWLGKDVAEAAGATTAGRGAEAAEATGEARAPQVAGPTGAGGTAEAAGPPAAGTAGPAGAGGLVETTGTRPKAGAAATAGLPCTLLVARLASPPASAPVAGASLATVDMSLSAPDAGLPADAAGPLAQDAAGRLLVSVRDADAARRLLAREEGVRASRLGAAALAALIRARRARRIAPSARVVVLLGDDPAADADGPPLAAEERAPGRPLPLADLVADPRHLLLLPPA